MLSTGLVLCGTGADDASVGVGVWSNPGNITAADTSNALFTFSADEQMHYLKATNFSLTGKLPANSVIRGIAVTARRAFLSSGTLSDTSVRMVKNGVISGNDNSAGAAWFSGGGPPYEDKVFGSSNDLWGLSWLPSDLLSSTSGWVMSPTLVGGIIPPTALVDAMWINVYYDIPGNMPSIF